MIEAKAWDWNTVESSYWKNVAEEFIPTSLHWKSKNFRRVLDLGCGIGRNSYYLARMGFNVYAFDLSESGLSALKREAKLQQLKIDTQKGDMHHLGYEDCFFDCVIAFHSIYHTNHEGLKSVISELFRVTKNEGEAYITLNSKESDVWKHSSNVKIDENTLLRDEAGAQDVPHTFLSYDEARSLFSNYKIDRFQQIFDYVDTVKHAHYFTRVIKT